MLICVLLHSVCTSDILYVKNAIHTTCMETLRYFPILGIFVFKSCSERAVRLSILNVGTFHTVGDLVT